MTPPPPSVISKSATVTTSATCAASIAHDSTFFWFCSGFEITCGGATAGSIQTATVTGLLGGTLNYTVAVPGGVTQGAYPLVIDFPTALPSVDTATDIVVSMPAAGSGNTGASVVVHGYKGAKQLTA